VSWIDWSFNCGESDLKTHCRASEFIILPSESVSSVQTPELCCHLIVAFCIVVLQLCDCIYLFKLPTYFIDFISWMHKMSDFNLPLVLVPTHLFQNWYWNKKALQIGLCHFQASWDHLLDYPPFTYWHLQFSICSWLFILFSMDSLLEHQILVMTCSMDSLLEHQILVMTCSMDSLLEHQICRYPVLNSWDIHVTENQTVWDKNQVLLPQCPQRVPSSIATA